MKQLLIKIVTFLGGAYFFLEFMLPEKIGDYEFGKYHAEIGRGVQIVGTMAIGLGILNILRVHGSAIVKRAKGWPNSIALMLGLFGVLGVDFWDMVVSERTSAAVKTVESVRFVTGAMKSGEKLTFDPARELELGEQQLFALDGSIELAALAGKQTKKAQATFADYIDAKTQALNLIANLGRTLKAPESTDTEKVTAATDADEALARLQPLARAVGRDGYENSKAKRASNFFFQAFYAPLGAAMFALLAFYIANAAYRAFRIRSFEATVMMTIAFIFMLGQIPFGPIYISEDLPEVRLWLLENISTPAFRGISFGVAIAGLAMAVRMWLSIDSGAVPGAPLPDREAKR